MLFDLKDAGISSDKHALIIPPFISRGKKVHPAPFTDSMSGKRVEFLFILNFCKSVRNECFKSLWIPIWHVLLLHLGYVYVYIVVTDILNVDVAANPRPMDPKKDLAVYGYGTVAWKERMEDWRKKQNERLQVIKHEGGGGKGDDELDDTDLPMYVPNLYSLYFRMLYLSALVYFFWCWCYVFIAVIACSILIPLILDFFLIFDMELSIYWCTWRHIC